jgi:hypothetical protein
MRTIILLSVAILVAGCAHNGGPEVSASTQAQVAKDEADLAVALSGRIAGPPQACVSQTELGGTRSFGRGIVLFSGRTGDVVYVNRPAAGCPDLGSGRAFKARTTATQFCRGDIVTVFDPVSGMDFGGCALGEFTPYRRAQ